MINLCGGRGRDVKNFLGEVQIISRGVYIFSKGVFCKSTIRLCTITYTSGRSIASYPNYYIIL